MVRSTSGKRIFFFVDRETYVCDDGGFVPVIFVKPVTVGTRLGVIVDGQVRVDMALVVLWYRTVDCFPGRHCTAVRRCVD